MNSEKKNLLDLQHSLSQTKGALFLSIGIGSWIAIFFGGKQVGIATITSFIIAGLFSVPFIFRAIKHFTKCNKIQKKIWEFIQRTKSSS